MTVTLYTRQGCHLCEDAHAVLEKSRQRHPFHLDIIDVDADPQLVAQYNECVPVVMIDGKVRFRGRVDLVLLERTLRGAGGSSIRR